MARQIPLFADIPLDTSAPRPAPIQAEHQDLARRLPAALRIGTSSWSVPGWQGLVYDRRYDEKSLARKGLEAYAQHPLLRLVGIDRSFYAPVPSEAYRDYAEATPSDFKFLVKAHDHLTTARFPDKPRYGQRRGQPNDRFLDPIYASEQVIGPAVEGLGDKLAALVFQFPPQGRRELGSPTSFADGLYEFLSKLPRGLRYAAEVRNPELLCDAYGDALAATGASHVVTVFPKMPSPREQADRGFAEIGSALVMRWMLRPDLNYEQAFARFSPFSRLAEPDLDHRRQLAELMVEAVKAQREVITTINNKAEGCSPLSVFELSRLIAEALEAS